MALLDSTALLMLIDPTAKAPLDPKTGKPVERCKERLEHLTDTLSQAGTKILIPTPVLAEVLVCAGASAKSAYLAEIQGAATFQIVAFDVKSAVELSFLLDGDGKAAGKKRPGKETWAKVKFDRQIIAIAKAYAVKEIYTDDRHLGEVATLNGIATHHIWDLPLPPPKKQGELDLPEPEDSDQEDEQ
jgi:predicted nucleic acid-binding protein